MINIVIADDHPLTREGLKSRISKEAIDMKIIGEASNSGELMHFLSKQLPNIVLLDITMPGKNGIEILKEIKKFYPKVGVLILTAHPEERYAVRAFKAGASGYFVKDVENLTSELIKAIRLVATQNVRYISPAVANQLVEAYTESEKEYEILSDRELEVLRKIASGKNIKAIAEDLSITIHTVYTYRNRVKEKLELTSDADFTKYAIQNNLVD